VTVQLVFALVVALWLGNQFTPLEAFALVATIATAVVVLIYILVNLSCIRFYLRERRDELNPLLHVVVPVLGILAFVPAWFTALGIGKGLFNWVSPLPYPLNRAGLVVAIWFALGIVVLLWLNARHPERIRETGRIFLEDEQPVPTAPTELPSTREELA
jgi:amino acid transporter